MRNTFYGVYHFLRKLGVRGKIKITITLQDPREVDRVMYHVYKERDMLGECLVPKYDLMPTFEIFGMEVRLKT